MARKNEFDPMTDQASERPDANPLVDDMIDGFVRMMEVSPDDFHGPVNLGNPGEFTILELAEKIIAKTGSSSKIEFRPLPSDDPTQRRPDITLAKQMLDWEPAIALDQGLDKTIAYFDALLRGEMEI